MKMKKFLIFYFIFVFSLFILHLALKTKETNAREQINVVKKQIFVILTDKIAPMGRVICQTSNGTIIYDWKSAEDAVLEMKEAEERYRKCERDYKTFVQYDKWPH